MSTSEPSNVWVVLNRWGGIREYTVMVNGKPYDSMTQYSGRRLTRDEMKSVADGYKEALDNYVSAMVE